MVNMALGIVNHDMPDLNVPDRTCLLSTMCPIAGSRYTSTTSSSLVGSGSVTSVKDERHTFMNHVTTTSPPLSPVQLNKYEY